MRCSSRSVPPLKAYPAMKAQLKNIRDALQGCREGQKTLIRLAGVTAFAFLADIALGLLALYMFALALWYFYRCREWLRSLRGIVCRECERARVPIFEPWVCGSCSRTNRDRRRTWADACECKATPHSFICPECRNPIIFDDYAFERSPDTSAWLPGYPPIIKKPNNEKRLPRYIDKHFR
jgi:hypothetical protein